jgi:restriction system protein
MAIPKHDELRVPVLKLLSTSDTMKPRNFVNPLAKEFNVSEEELNLMYPSGNAYVFYDRLSWALSYLFMAGLVEKPQRGLYKISPKGLEMLKTPDKINSFVDDVVANRQPQEKRTKKSGPKTETYVETSNSQTPQEQLLASYDDIRKNVYSEIIATILSKTPAEFEKLVVALLQKMGYGGEIKDSGVVTKMSSDEGIDGIIKEDVLGLGRIHIQAKCYKPEVTVGREDIQKFVGALAVAQSNKGVFITTSSFTKNAFDYVKNLNGSTTIVLIDGNKLAEYIYDYNLGMQTENTLYIKKLDADFWDSMKEKETKD